MALVVHRLLQIGIVGNCDARTFICLSNVYPLVHRLLQIGIVGNHCEFESIGSVKVRGSPITSNRNSWKPLVFASIMAKLTVHRLLQIGIVGNLQQEYDHLQRESLSSPITSNRNSWKLPVVNGSDYCFGSSPITSNRNSWKLLEGRC